MKVDMWLYAMIGMANASALTPRQPKDSNSLDSPDYSGYPDDSEDYPKDDYEPEPPQYSAPPEDDYTPDPPQYSAPPMDSYKPYVPPKDSYKPKDPPKDSYKPYEPPKDDYKPYQPPKDDYKPYEPPKDDYKPYEPPKDDYKPYEPPKDDYKPSPPEDDYKPSPPEYSAPPADDYKPSPPSKDYPKGGYSTDEYGSDYPKDKAPKAWKPKTHHPEFFSLKVDDRCLPAPVAPAAPLTEDEQAAAAAACFFDGFAIRLEKGVVIATPYNKWWDPKLPIFFVDDDTQTYTVSKKPLQLYIDATTGALRYAPVGWLPPNSIAISFYKLGNNPLGKVGPSPSYFAWPTTEGRANTGDTGKTWWLCPISTTGQYQVFISDVNFGDSGQGGVTKNGCQRRSLAAINANPWKSSGGY